MVNGTILSFQNMYYNVHVNFLQSLSSYPLRFSASVVFGVKSRAVKLKGGCRDKKKRKKKF